MIRKPNCIEALAVCGASSIEKVNVSEQDVPFDALAELPSGRVVSTKVEAIRRQGSQACFVTPHGEFYAVCPDDEQHRATLEKWVPTLNQFRNNPMGSQLPKMPLSCKVFVAGDSPWDELKRFYDEHVASEVDPLEDEIAAAIARAMRVYVRKGDYDEPDGKSAEAINEAWARVSAAFDVRVDKWDERQQRAVEEVSQSAFQFYMTELGESLQEHAEDAALAGAKSLKTTYGIARRQAMHLKAQAGRIVKLVSLYSRANYGDIVEALANSGRVAKGFAVVQITGAIEALLKRGSASRPKLIRLGELLREARESDEAGGQTLIRWIGGGEALLTVTLTMMIAFQLQRLVIVACENEEFEYPEGWPHELVHDALRSVYREKKLWLEMYTEIAPPLAESSMAIADYILRLTANCSEATRLLALSTGSREAQLNDEGARRKATVKVGAGLRMTEDGIAPIAVQPSAPVVAPVSEKPSAELIATKRELDRTKEELVALSSELDEARSLNLALKRALDAELMQESGEQSQSNDLPRVEDLQGVIVGGHENWHAKVRKALPKVRVMHPDASTINTDTFTDADFVAFHTNYCNHRLFEQAYKDAKKRAKRIFFIERNNIGHVLQQVARECGARVEGVN